MIAEGTYNAKATGGEYGETPEKHSTFVSVTFQIADGPLAGQTSTWTGWFTEKTQERTLESLRACGCTFGSDGTDITILDGITKNQVQIVVKHETYEKDGETKTVAKVAFVNGGNRGISEEMRLDDAKKAAFREKMRGTLAAGAAKNAAPKAVANVPF